MMAKVITTAHDGAGQVTPPTAVGVVHPGGGGSVPRMFVSRYPLLAGLFSERPPFALDTV